MAQLEEGARVEITGLAGRTELNGRRGTARGTGGRPLDTNGGRLRVRLDGASRQTIAVRRSNLLALETCAGCGGATHARGDGGDGGRRGCGRCSPAAPAWLERRHYPTGHYYMGGWLTALLVFWCGWIRAFRHCAYVVAGAWPLRVLTGAAAVCQFDMRRVHTEVLWLIFDYLDTRTALVVVPRVCRAWKDAVAGMVIHKLDLTWAVDKLCALAADPDRQTAAVWRLASRAGGARQVALSCRPNQTRTSCLTDAALKRICRLRQLTSICLVGCLDVTDRGLRHLGGQLARLNLGYCISLTDAGLAQLSVCKQLATLNLSGCVKVTDAGLSHVGQCTQLASLVLGNCVSITDAGLAHVARCHRLTSLDLWNCSLVTDAGLAHVGPLDRLATLRLSGCSVTDAGLAHVARCPHLASLDLKSCGAITDAGLVLLGQCKMLARLDLADCGQVTDAGVAHVARRLARLASLSLQSCPRVTDLGLRALADEAPPLVALDLGWCGITDAGLAVVGRFQRLASLKLGGSDSITDKGLAHVARCPHLASLDLTSCAAITDKGLVLLGQCKMLASLHLSDCKNVSDAGLARTCGKLTRLTDLELTRCPQLKPALFYILGMEITK